MIKQFTQPVILSLFDLFISILTFAQEKIPDGIPVQGAIPILSENKASNINNRRLSNNKNSTSTPATSTGSSAEVGITEGKLTVSLSGAANYNIPIEVLPGIKGIVPQIGLFYDSQSGNDIAGYGWAISGLSSITRIPSTKYHDETNDPVDFDALDRFALDGKRLVVKIGTLNAYASHGATYETEAFSNIKITSYGISPYGADHGPEYFVVEYPDGSKARYGNDLESRSETKWCINYWENPQGIRINYAYSKYINSPRITRITYGATDANPGGNTILFYYKKRRRLENAYIGGIPFTEAYILTYIDVHASNTPNSHYRKYTLTHDTTSLSYERLTSITASTGNEGNMKSLNPAVFTYNTTPDTVTFNPITTNLSVNNISYQNAATISGDFNGNGKTDIILYPTHGTDARKKYWLFTNFQKNNNIGSEIPVPDSFDEIFPVSWLGGNSSFGYKLMPKQGWTLLKTNTTDHTTTFSTYATGITAPVYLQYQKSYSFPQFTYHYTRIRCNRGLTGPDVIYNNHPPNTIPTTITKEIPKVYLSGDFNGNGLTDLIAIDKSVVFSYQQGCSTVTQQHPGGTSYFINLDKRIIENFVNVAGQVTASDYSVFKIADHNGDGKSDVLVFDSGKVTVYTLTDDNLLTLQCTYTDITISLNSLILIGDYNGDGKADFIIPTGNGRNYVKHTSTGVSFKKSKHHYDIPYTHSRQTGDCSHIYHIIPNDFNLDGKTDLIYVENTGCLSSGQASITVRYYKNTHTNFISAGSASTSAHNGVDRYSLPVFLSYDKINNSQDISFISKNNIFNFTTSKSNREDTHLKTITLGNGVKDIISYSPLTAPDSYTFDCVYNHSPYVANYPNADIINAPSITVVSRLERQSKNEYKKQDYKYFGAVYNVEGLGFLGFRSTMNTNWHNDNNAIISNISKFDISKRGALSENYTVMALAIPSLNFAPSSFITKSTFTNSIALFPNRVFKVKTDASTTINSLEGTTTETTCTYDNYNNPLTFTTLAKQGNTVDKKDVITLEYFNQPQGTSYIIGRLTKKNTETYGSDEMTTEELYTYNSNHLLSEVKTKGHNTDYVTTRYEYDSFGNVIKNTLIATGIPPRVTSVEYDTSGRFITKKTSVEGLNTTFTYNKNGWPLTIATPDGRTLTTEYDAWDKKTKVSDYFNTTFSYSNVNEKTLVRVSGDDGSYSEFLSDDLGRVIKSGSKNIDGSISYTDHIYDILGRKIKSSEPYTGSTPNQWNEVKYDRFDRLIKSIAATGKTQTITYSGLTTRVFDGLKTESITKNAANNIVSKTDDISTNNVINQHYFANGGLKQVACGGSTISVAQDGWGRRTQLKEPSAGTYQYQYNSLGEITKEITPNGIIRYTRDDLGRLKYKTEMSPDENATIVSYSYNSDGTLNRKITDSSTLFNEETAETYNYQYDTFKRPVKILYTSKTAAFTKEFVYDTFGRPEKEKVTATSLTNNKTSSRTFRYTYKNGFMHQILDDATSQLLWATNSVNERGQLTNGSFGNGLSQVNTYDTYGFLSVLETRSPSESLFRFTTNFDPVRENLNHRSNSLFNTDEPFEYDNQDRLIKWNKESVTLLKDDFSLGTGDFGTQFAAITTNQNGRLKVTATQAYAGVKKTLLTKAKIGDKLSVKVNIDKGTTHKVRVLVVEYDPASGLGSESFKGYVQNGLIELEHTVSNYPYITLNIDKDGTGNDIGTATTFYIDDLSVEKQITETQQYDDYGRITENNLGQYHYNDNQKAYQNTTIDLNPEAASYYENREGIFNDGMEEQKGWSDLGLGWDIFGKPIYDDSKSKSGKYSLKIHNPKNTDLTMHSDRWIPIDNLRWTAYTFSGWVYSDGPTSQIFLFMNSENETGYYTRVADIYTEATHKWVYLEQTVYVPPYIKKLNIRVDNNGGGNVWFDDIRIKKAYQPTALHKLNITYDIFRKPKTIEETGVEKIDFKYNDNQYRTTMFYGGLQSDITKRQFRRDYNFDGSTEITTNNTTGPSSFVFYVGGDAYTAPVVVKDDGTTGEYLYLHRDYQGSILAVTNQAGAIVEKRLFDPWGNIVKVQDRQGHNLTGLTVLDRGYTGHEHIESVGLINMNGRLYDPKLHRFLSPDNFIQDPYNTQSYNRYGYCLNNPLKYVDYSGEIYGNEYYNGGINPTGQFGLGNTLLFIRDNYDQWGIKGWFNKTFSARNYNNAANGFDGFIDSAVNFFKSLFGGSKEPRVQTIKTPEFSNFQSTQGWQDNGFNHVAHPRDQEDPKPKKYKGSLKSSHGEKVYSLEEWYNTYKHNTYGEITTEAGYKQGLPAGPKMRYVKNPIDGNIMDMRHVSVVGYGMGNTVGDMVEHIQYGTGDPSNSAYDIQDYYSNKTGAYFHQLRHFGNWASNSWAYDFRRFILTQYKVLQPAIMTNIPKQ